MFDLYASFVFSPDESGSGGTEEVETPPAEEEDKKPAKPISPLVPTPGHNPYSPANLEETLRLLDEQEASEKAATENEPSEEEDKEDGIPSQPPTTTKKYAGTYESPEKLEEGYVNLQALLARQAQELGDLRRDRGEQPLPEAPQTQGEPGVVIGDDGKRYDESTGFPLDELGVPYRPPEWWRDQRWEQWVDHFEGDEEAARPHYQAELRDWNEQYSEERAAKRQELAGRDFTEIQQLQEQQKEEIPKVRSALLETLLAVHPEEEAKKHMEAVWLEAQQLVDKAEKSGEITHKQASSPGIVREAVGEALKKMFIEDRLSAILYPAKGKGLGPQRLPGSPIDGGGSGGSAGSNGKAPSKVRVTEQDRKFAAALTAAGRKTTPEEIAEEREEEEKGTKK